jgi:hypothetical protein
MTVEPIIALILDELDEPSPQPIKKRLKEMPRGITGMYELILHRLGSKGGLWEHNMRRKLLLWTALCNRPVTITEMQYACVTPDGEKSFDPKTVALPTAKQMMVSCNPLLEVYDTDRLRFTHRSVKQFLLQSPQQLSPEFRKDEKVTSCLINKDEGNALIAMTCGRYIPNEESDR